uniref:Uncharacterized protein n=1 Tax=Arundo donax TaxID=35708 RepID=A0A0A8Y2D7_ARUDO
MNCITCELANFEALITKSSKLQEAFKDVLSPRLSVMAIKCKRRILERGEACIILY